MPPAHTHVMLSGTDIFVLENSFGIFEEREPQPKQKDREIVYKLFTFGLCRFDLISSLFFAFFFHFVCLLLGFLALISCLISFVCWKGKKEMHLFYTMVCQHTPYTYITHYTLYIDMRDLIHQRQTESFEDKRSKLHCKCAIGKM